MSQTKTKSQAEGKVKQDQYAQELMLELLHDTSSRLLIIKLFDKAWAQLAHESAADFYSRLFFEFSAKEFASHYFAPIHIKSSHWAHFDWARLLEKHKAEIIAHDYVDPILFESGFFQDQNEHDDVMKRVLANYEEKKGQQTK